MAATFQNVNLHNIDTILKLMDSRRKQAIASAFKIFKRLRINLIDFDIGDFTRNMLKKIDFIKIISFFHYNWVSFISNILLSQQNKGIIEA